MIVARVGGGGASARRVFMRCAVDRCVVFRRFVIYFRRFASMT
jgi:hypothetical protein